MFCLQAGMGQRILRLVKLRACLFKTRGVCELNWELLSERRAHLLLLAMTPDWHERKISSYSNCVACWNSYTEHGNDNVHDGFIILVIKSCFVSTPRSPGVPRRPRFQGLLAILMSQWFTHVAFWKSAVNWATFCVGAARGWLKSELVAFLSILFWNLILHQVERVLSR